jgi:hypothetical protein
MTDDAKTSLDHLVALVSPPPSGRHCPTSENRGTAEMGLPSDLYALTSHYGSGDFEHERLGCPVWAYNPFAPSYRETVHDAHVALAQYRDAEGEKMVPYPLHPTSPGLRIWGRNDQGDLFLWLTEGEPDQWPVLYFGDARIWVRYDMPVVVFLEKLFTGQIARTEFGYGPGPDDRLAPEDVTFHPRSNR